MKTKTMSDGFLVNLRKPLKVCGECCREEKAHCHLMAWPGNKVVHAVVTRNEAMETFFGNQLFGGGMTVLCGQKAVGRALISPELQPARRVTCKRCRTACHKRGWIER